jgi:hypothetical protein
MSHVAHTGSQAATRSVSRALAITLAVLVLAGIAVVLIVTIGGDDTTKVSSPAPVSSVARPDEGNVAIPSASATRLRPDQGLGATAVDSQSVLSTTRPDQGLGATAVDSQSVLGTSGRPDEGSAPISAPAARANGALDRRYEAWNRYYRGK